MNLEAAILTIILGLFFFYAATHIYMNVIEKLSKKFGYKDKAEMGCLVYIFLLLTLVLLLGVVF